MSFAPVALLQQGLALGLRIAELAKQGLGVGMFEVVAGIFLLRLQKDVAVGDPVVAIQTIEIEVVDVLDALNIHGQALQPIGQFARDGRAFDARHLLEIGELADFHAIAPAFPAKAPGAERGALPVVLDEADVMQGGVDANGRQRAQIEVLQVGRGGLQDHLKLVIMLEPVGILPIAPILGTARGLHIGGLPRLGAEGAQSGGGVEGASPHLHVIGLQNHAALLRPEALERENQALKGPGGIKRWRHGGTLMVWRATYWGGRRRSTGKGRGALGEAVKMNAR